MVAFLGSAHQFSNGQKNVGMSQIEADPRQFCMRLRGRIIVTVKGCKERRGWRESQKGPKEQYQKAFRAFKVTLSIEAACKQKKKACKQKDNIEFERKIITSIKPIDAAQQEFRFAG
jgi:hypothetical protein